MTRGARDGPPLTRRGLLRGLVGVGGTALTGCVGGVAGPDPVPTTTGPDDSNQQPSGGADPAPTDDPLDMREANVVGLAVEATDGGYRFDVTLVHDDDGESGYADWWQVESLAGERLGRRELLHAHGSDPFTRSTTIVVPDDSRCVIVRGHDATHGYGGQAMVVDLEAVTRRVIRQGSEPRSLDASACPGR